MPRLHLTPEDRDWMIRRLFRSAICCSFLFVLGGLIRLDLLAEPTGVPSGHSGAGLSLPTGTQPSREVPSNDQGNSSHP
ncbi:MAG: hypothetical protein AAF989_05130, partial [Planctomycetota bacterium]